MVRVGALQGPTGLGLVELMEKTEQKQAGNIYEFTLAGAPDEISGKLVSGELDIASVPTNLAATLYAKTEGKVKIIGVNTLGVLYLLHKDPEAETDTETTVEAEESEEETDSGTESDDESTAETEAETGEEATAADADEAAAEEEQGLTFADLEGETIYSTGQGATQEYVLNYLLQQSGVSDVEIIYKSEHAELASLVVAGEAEYALLPQPFVTTVTGKDNSVSVAMDITKEWEAATDGKQLTMGCVVVRTEFLEKNQDAVDKFLEELAESVDYVNSNVAESAALAGKFEVIAEDVAAKAIPLCNIVCLTGQEMKDSVTPYLEVLAAADPKSVGGALPDEAFYYIP